MGQKDISEKVLEDFDDVFADIVNVLLFDGQQIIYEEELSNAKDKSQYKADDSLIHEQERDVTKYWNKGKIRLALCGFENQMVIDKDMPFRVIGYDGASYRSQLLGEEKERYPVITLVLYFGMKPWKNPHSLYDCLEIKKELYPYVSNYKINVFEIAYLTEEHVKMFKSDFRIVADYFVQMRKNHDYQPSQDIIRHVDALLKLMSVLTKDNRFEEIQREAKGDVENMCEVLDKAEARGEVKGEVKAYANVGLSVADIAKKVGITEDEVKNILASLQM